MASDIWLRTILIVRKETRFRLIGYCYRLTARVLLYAPSHRQDNTYHSLYYTSRGALARMRNSSRRNHLNGSVLGLTSGVNEQCTSRVRAEYEWSTSGVRAEYLPDGSTCGGALAVVRYTWPVVRCRFLQQQQMISTARMMIKMITPTMMATKIPTDTKKTLSPVNDSPVISHTETKKLVMCNNIITFSDLFN